MNINEITRDLHVPNPIWEGKISNIDWFSIGKIFNFSEHPDEPPELNIVDSVFIENGTVSFYLYTNSLGKISNKLSNYTHLSKIKDEFLNLQQIPDDDQPRTQPIALLHLPGKDPKPLLREEFKTICSGSTSNQPFILQLFVPSKSCKDSFRTFRGTFRIDRLGRTSSIVERVDMASSVTGSSSRTTNRSMSRSANQVVESGLEALVHRIRLCLCCAVLELVAEFVQDEGGRVWLVRTVSCSISKASETKRSSSAESLKGKRISEVAQIQDNKSLTEDSSLPLPLPAPIVGRHSEQRLALRAARQPTPDDHHISLILQSIDESRAKSRDQSRPPPLSPSKDRSCTHSQIGPLHQIPNARLDAEAPWTTETSLLGTSQLKGCQGDFCHFDSSYLEDPTTSDHLQANEGLSEFRRRLLRTEDNDFSDLGTHVSFLMGKEPQGRSADPQMVSLPHRAIIQARYEMPLVKLQLRRHKRGESGDYVSEDGFSDLCTASSLPGHYYDQVPVCGKCYHIYCIVEEARELALKKIARRKERIPSPARVLSVSQSLSVIPSLSSNPSQSEDERRAMISAMQAVSSLTKLDIAELKTMTKPPAAVEVVVEAVVGLLTGRLMSFQESKRLLSGGEAFLNMLRDFKLEDVSDSRLRLVEPYADNPVFRPENVQPVSLCAAKFCSWVLGVVQAARWQRGLGHKRTNLLPSLSNSTSQLDSLSSSKSEADLTFVQKLQNKKATKLVGRDHPQSQASGQFSSDPSLSTSLKKSKYPQGTLKSLLPSTPQLINQMSLPSPSSFIEQSSVELKHTKNQEKRIRSAMMSQQKKSNSRLASHNKSEGNLSLVGNLKEFRCSDGITRMPFITLGEISLQPTSTICNFIVIHDFFDTCDSTAILMKQIVHRHEGCQVLCFNYPGQANTVWPRPPPAEKERGAQEPVLSNDWIADRVHELLQHVESDGSFLLTNPFHLVGIGNGSSIAASFLRKWGMSRFYSEGLKSFVSINGFLYPDPQLSAILHSASQVFESTPHSRPDIPVSYWSRFLFSESYLLRVNPNLALNILTAVSNPITNDGRCKIVKGCLNHSDLRGALSPDFQPRLDFSYDPSSSLSINHGATAIPLILLQSTDNSLVNASNIDPFLAGRKVQHLWSHQLNILSEEVLSKSLDVTAQWVGRLSSSPSDYQQFNVLGKSGLRMVLDTLKNPRGAFVMWVRAGHAVQQEFKSSVLDLLDVLASPSEEYTGLSLKSIPAPTPAPTPSISISLPSLAIRPSSSEQILFKLEPSRRALNSDPVKPEQPAETFEEPFPLFTLSKPDRSTSINSLLEYEGKSSSPTSEYVDPPVPRDLPPRPSPRLDPNIILPSLTDISVPSPPSNMSPRPSIQPPLSLPIQLIPKKEIISTKEQRQGRAWAPDVPDLSSTFDLEAQLAQKQKEYLELQAKVQEARMKSESEKLTRLEKAQLERSTTYEKEDKEILKRLRSELETRQREREYEDRQRRLEVQEIEKSLIQQGIISDLSVDSVIPAPVPELPPVRYEVPPELPKSLLKKEGILEQLDSIVQDEVKCKEEGMSLSQFEEAKRQVMQRQLERDSRLRHLAGDEQQMLYNECSLVIQRVGRGYNGRKRARALDELRKKKRDFEAKVLLAQALVRGFIDRRRVRRFRRIFYQNLLQGTSVVLIQSVYRAHLAKKFVNRIRRNVNARRIQRVFRGRLGRLTAKRERDRLELIRRKNRCASTIQSAWRMKIAKEEFRSLRVHILAATEIQRRFRGYLGRKKMQRRRAWESATPGPERIKLGLQLIEESKIAFERQQEEIDALHRAQERAEARVSHIHAELKDSEKELQVLEKELQEIDQIERDLQILTHERDILKGGGQDAAGLTRTASKGHAHLVMGKQSDSSTDPDKERKRKAEAYALEMTIQIKRAEREKKRQELESEFSSVFLEVDNKKKALRRLETALADMESTRERKEREFRRLQKNLMQLLLEQKQELDELREKGIALETATATTAAAATATAMKAKEHEKRSSAMFSQTEELMKFQFMSMSLSYFSSLNMLKQLRDMNADTTSAAVASSADAAASAAAAATAANLPNVKKLDLKSNDFVELAIHKKKQELEALTKAEQETAKAKATALPETVKMWTVTDVCRWLDTLSLGQYASKFEEATIDGPFLMELREEDLVQVLGISHKLHVRKILLSREKLKPLSLQEIEKKAAVEREEVADVKRDEIGVPSVDAVFSQARNGRLKRVEDSLNLGFAVDTEDERGNTMLLVAAQNSNKRLVEMLLLRGANINHQNAQGNTALHFALAFDSEGVLGEYLIEHGADDTLENVDGLTPYDGVTG